MKIEIIDAPTPASGVASAASEATALEMETLRAEAARQMDLHLRLAADFENFKRRSRAEAEARAVAQKDNCCRS